MKKLTTILLFAFILMLSGCGAESKPDTGNVEENPIPNKLEKNSFSVHLSSQNLSVAAASERTSLADVEKQMKKKRYEDRKNKEWWRAFTDNLIPLVSLLVVGATTCFGPIWTGWENRKLARETNAYLKEKEIFDEFSEACSKYVGIIASIPAMNFFDKKQRFVNFVRSLIKCEWSILKGIKDSLIHDEIRDMLIEFEGHANDLIMQKLEFFVAVDIWRSSFTNDDDYQYAAMQLLGIYMDPTKDSPNEDLIYKLAKTTSIMERQLLTKSAPLQKKLMQEQRQMKESLLEKVKK